MKALFQGAPYVVAAGLLLGAALQPQLAVSDQPGGPQMLMGVSAPRASDDMSWTASYSGPVPDYVLGTDWTRPPAYSEAAYTSAPEPDLYLPVDDYAPPPEPVFRAAEPVTVAAIAAPPRYPSEGGEVVVSHAPVAPEPEPQQLVEAFPPV